MLTLKQIEEEAKKRKVDLSYERDFPYSLSKGPKFTEKKYQAWKKKILAAWQAYDNREIAYRKKYGYTQAYNPIMESRRVSEESLRKEYENHLRYSDDAKSLSLKECQSSYSCAIYEFGGFPIKHKLEQHWDLLLAYYVNKTKYHFLKCATPVKPEYAALRKALRKLGFEMRAKERSNHGKYFVEVWEYIKPMKKEKKGKK